MVPSGNDKATPVDSLGPTRRGDSSDLPEPADPTDLYPDPSPMGSGSVSKGVRSAGSPDTTFDSPDDQSLVSAALKGNPRAFERLVERYFGMVYAIAYARLGHRESAEDLAQEVFHRVFLHLGRLRDPRRFGPWIGTIARNLASNWKRNGQTRSRLIPMLPLEELPRELADRLSENARRRLEQEEEHDALHEALHQLPPDQRELILLHYAEGWTLNDIAARLGVHSTTVGRRIEKALRTMRRFLEPILRETAPRLAARPDAKVHTVGLIAATALLTPSSKATLAAAAAKGLSGLVAAPAGAAAAASTPWGKLWILLSAKLAALRDWFRDLGTIQKTAIGAISFLLVAGGGGAVVLYAATKPVRHLYFDRFRSAVMELDDGGSGNVAVRRVWPEDGSPWAKFMGRNYRVERIGNFLLLRADYEPGFGLKLTGVFLYRPNSQKGYDLVGRVRYIGGEISPLNRHEDQIVARWRKGDLPTKGAVPMAWLPLPDSAIVDVLKTWVTNKAAGESAMDRLLLKRPHLAVYQLLRLDMAIYAKNENKVKELLNRFASDLKKSGNELVAASPGYYTFWLDEMEQGRQGRNLWTRLGYGPGSAAGKNLKTDLSDQLRIVSGIRYTDSDFNPDWGFFLHNAQPISNFLELQVAAKDFRVLGEFRLFQGDPAGALSLMLPCFRMATVLTAHSTLLIDRLIGMAIRSISIEGVRLAFLDGMNTPQDIRRFWPLLDDAYKADLDATRVFKNPMENILFRSSPENSDADFLEARTRNWVAHAHVAAIHSAVAARYGYLTTGRFPITANEFAPLIPGGPDPDPFSDFKKPLRVAEETATRPYLVYSVGPDRQDQDGAVNYDPTNGTTSAGDIVVEVPRKRKYPFPLPGKLATTRDAILAQFPNGLPHDPFADWKLDSYAVTDTNPAWILSWGPDTDQKARMGGNRETLARNQTAPAQYGVSTSKDHLLLYPDLVPEVAYDPTNGTVSTGDLYFCSANPNATMILNNLPPTPTPFPPRESSAAPKPPPPKPLGMFFNRLDGGLYRIDDASGQEVRFERLWPHNDEEILSLLRQSGSGGRNGFERRIIRVGRRLVFVVLAKVPKDKKPPERLPFLFPPEILEPNRFGGYDRIGIQSPPNDPWNVIPALIEHEKNGAGPLPMRGTPVPEAWIPVGDPAFLEVLKQKDSNPVEADRVLRQLMARHPEKPFYAAAALDLALVRRDQRELVDLLKRFENPLRSCGHPYLSIMPDYYHEWLRAWARSQRGENLWTVSQNLQDSATRSRRIPNLPPYIPLLVHGDINPHVDLPQLVSTFQGARLSDTYFPLDRPLLFRDTRQATWGCFLVATRVMGTLGDFRLFAGDLNGALQLDLPCYRIGVVLSRDPISWMGKAIGASVRLVGGWYLNNVYLDGIPDADQMQKWWPALDELYRADLDSTRHRVLREITDPLFRTDPVDDERNHLELDTRDLVSHARLALLHSAVAARYRRLTTGSYPMDASHFGPLLPGGIDPDPFQDFKKPLRVRRSKSRPLTLYSFGPDRKDQQATVEYDPTNGTLSAGDLSLDVPEERTYPFPPPGRLATTRNGILAQFPNGLPPDRFATAKSSSYAVTDTTPAWILSWGPDRDQQSRSADVIDQTLLDAAKFAPAYRKVVESGPHWYRIAPVQTLPGPGHGVSTDRGEFVRYPHLVPDVVYDPTNGVTSKGDLYFCTAAPNVSILLHNLPPTPTPFR